MELLPSAIKERLVNSLKEVSLFDLEDYPELVLELVKEEFKSITGCNSYSEYQTKTNTLLSDDSSDFALSESHKETIEILNNTKILKRNYDLSRKKLDKLNNDKLNCSEKLTKAINSFLDVYIDKNHRKKFSEENIKLYKGFKN